MLHRSLILCAGVGLLVAFFLPWLDMLGLWSFASGNDWSRYAQAASRYSDMYLYSAQELAFSGAPTCRGELQLQLLAFPAAGAGLVFTALARGRGAGIESMLIGALIVVYWFFDPFFGVLPGSMERLGVAHWPVIFLVAMVAGLVIIRPSRKTVAIIAVLSTLLFGYWLYSFVGLYIKAGHIGLWLATGCALVATLAGLLARPAGPVTRKQLKADTRRAKASARKLTL